MTGAAAISNARVAGGRDRPGNGRSASGSLPDRHADAGAMSAGNLQALDGTGSPGRMVVSRTATRSRPSRAVRRARQGGRLAGTILVIVAFGLGFAAIATDARRMHVDRMVNHEVALRDMMRD